MKALILALCFSLTSCSYFRLYTPPQPKTMMPKLDPVSKNSSPEECQRASSRYFWFGVGAVMAATLGGSSGVTTIAVKDNEQAVLGLGIAAVIFGAAGAGLTFASGYYAALHSSACK